MPQSDTTHSPLIEPDVRLARIRLSQKHSPSAPGPSGSVSVSVEKVSPAGVPMGSPPVAP